jgi:D-sedoheptulose 7-phosphate isomerase
MNEDKFLTDYFNECANFISNKDVNQHCIDAKKMLLNTKESGRKVMFAGNGASASISNHASLDFTKQAKIKSVNFNESALITNYSIFKRFRL